MPQHPQTTDRSLSELTAHVLAQIVQHPDLYTSQSLAGHLGEPQRRVQRVLADLAQTPWQVQRDGQHRLSVSLPDVPAGER